MLNERKRILIKSLGISSIWVSPIVSSVVLPAHASTSATPVYEEFRSAGTDSYTVPSGVTQLKITVNGAGGGTMNYDKNVDEDSRIYGGNGEQVEQTVVTVPGDTLNVTVGGGGYNGWGARNGIAPHEAGLGGTPGDGGDAADAEGGGGGGGYSQVSGTGFSIQAGGGGGGNDGSTLGGSGGGTNGGAPGFGSNGGNAGNGLGGKGSSTDPTIENPPLKGEDGSVVISTS